MPSQTLQVTTHCPDQITCSCIIARVRGSPSVTYTASWTTIPPQPTWAGIKSLPSLPQVVTSPLRPESPTSPANFPTCGPAMPPLRFSPLRLGIAAGWRPTSRLAGLHRAGGEDAGLAWICVFVLPGKRQIPEVHPNPRRSKDSTHYDQLEDGTVHNSKGSSRKCKSEIQVFQSLFSPYTTLNRP